MANKGYIRLWERPINSRESTPRARKKNASASICRKGDTSASGKCKIKRRAERQSASTKRKLSSASVSSTRANSPQPQRSQSSLGLATQPAITKGFDLQEYVRRHGSAGEIRIGINGATSSDKYFERYLEECEFAAQQENNFPLSSCSLLCDDEVCAHAACAFPSVKDDDLMMTLSAYHPEIKPVPLCWEDLLKTSEVYLLQHAYSMHEL